MDSQGSLPCGSPSSGEDLCGSSADLLPSPRGSQECASLNPGQSASASSGDLMLDGSDIMSDCSPSRPSDSEAKAALSPRFGDAAVGERVDDLMASEGDDSDDGDSDDLLPRARARPFCSRKQRSLEDGFQWPTYLFTFLVAVVGVAGIADSLLAQKLSVSSFFSGVGTAELAQQSLCVAGAALGFSLGLTTASVCDSGRRNLDTLAFRVSSNCCIWSDILAFSPVGQTLYEKALAAGSLDFWATWRELRNAGLFKATDKCKQHPGICETPSTHVDISGPPCQAWSRAGKRLGLRSPGMVLLLVWCVWLLTAKPLCVILENVVGFDVGVMVEILGDLYDHVVLRVAPRHAGFTLLRTRLYDTFSNSSDLHPLVIKFIPYLQSI